MLVRLTSNETDTNRIDNRTFVGLSRANRIKKELMQIWKLFSVRFEIESNKCLLTYYATFYANSVEYSAQHNTTLFNAMFAFENCRKTCIEIFFQYIKMRWNLLNVKRTNERTQRLMRDWACVVNAIRCHIYANHRSIIAQLMIDTTKLWFRKLIVS